MIKRILITTVILAGIFAAYWTYGFLSMDNARSGNIVSFADDFCLTGFKNKSGWSQPGEKSCVKRSNLFGRTGALAMGTWYGYDAK